MEDRGRKNEKEREIEREQKKNAKNIHAIS